MEVKHVLTFFAITSFRKHICWAVGSHHKGGLLCFLNKDNTTYFFLNLL